ncbi:MAG: hypothetical protein C4523_08530, partial [Myxococcales bacterium]
MAKRVCILIEQDFQDMEVLYPRYRLIEAGHEVVVAGLGQKTYKGKYGYPVNTDADNSFKIMSGTSFICKLAASLTAFFMALEVDLP